MDFDEDSNLEFESDPSALEELESLQPPPDQTFEQRERFEALEAALAELAPRARRVLELRFGLNGQPPLGVAQIARELQLSQRSIYTLQQGAFEHLRHHQPFLRSFL